MENVSNVAAVASSIVFGDGTEHTEPVSGTQGDVSKGEPYDAGNMEPKDQEKLVSLEGDQNTKAEALRSTGDSGVATNESSDPKPDATEGGPERSADAAAAAGVDAGHDDEPGPKSDGEGPGRADNSAGQSDATNAVGASAETDKQTGQKVDSGDQGKKARSQNDKTSDRQENAAESKTDKPSLGQRIKAKFRKL